MRSGRGTPRPLFPSLLLSQACPQVGGRSGNGLILLGRDVDGNGYMVVADTQQPLAPAEPGNHPGFFFREGQLFLNQPGLLFLHLHNEFDAAAIQDALATVCFTISPPVYMSTVAVALPPLTLAVGTAVVSVVGVPPSVVVPVVTSGVDGT